MKIIYHGSTSIIESPIYHFEGSKMNNDYGYGFYCTTNIDMAKEWANRKSDNGFANKYSFDDRNLKILDLTDKSKYSVLNWIAILMHNRDIDQSSKIVYKEAFEYLEKHYYINTLKYDVVIGYRADDAYFRFPMMFVSNNLTLEKLEEIYLNGKLGKQYVLVSEKAFKRVKFIKAIVATSPYHERYLSRVGNASNRFYRLEYEDRFAKGKRIRDLIEEDK